MLFFHFARKLMHLIPCLGSVAHITANSTHFSMCIRKNIQRGKEEKKKRNTGIVQYIRHSHENGNVSKLQTERTIYSLFGFWFFFSCVSSSCVVIFVFLVLSFFHFLFSFYFVQSSDATKWHNEIRALTIITQVLLFFISFGFLIFRNRQHIHIFSNSRFSFVFFFFYFFLHSLLYTHIHLQYNRCWFILFSSSSFLFYFFPSVFYFLFLFPVTYFLNSFNLLLFLLLKSNQKLTIHIVEYNLMKMLWFPFVGMRDHIVHCWQW